MRRILNISHNDLDGVAAAAAIHLAHEALGDHVQTKFASYGDVDTKLLAALNRTGHTRFDRIVLSDICMEAPGQRKYPDNQTKQLLAYQLPAAITKFTVAGGELVVLDHHGARTESAKRFYGGWLHPLSILEAKDANGVARAGSELAGRYFIEVAVGAGTASRQLCDAVIDFMRLAGDYDVWRNPHGFGGVLAMAMSLLWDEHTALQEMLAVIQEGAIHLEKTDWCSYPTPFEVRDRVWAQVMDRFTAPCLHAYAERAKAMFEAELAKTRKTLVIHGPKLVEVYTDFQPSLISERIYQETGGVVAIRYVKDRGRVPKWSFRCSRDFAQAANIDLGAILTPLGGGGHACAAGIEVGKAGQANVDRAIAVVNATLSEVAA